MNWHARPVPGLLLRLGFAAAGIIAPSLAARAAERLLHTPPRHRPSRREREAIAEGDAFALTVNGETLRGWRIGAGPAVLLVHGWGGGAGQLAAFIAPLPSAGCSAVAFDAPVHGGSTARLTSGITFADVSAVAVSVRARAAVGYSLGATAVGCAVAGGLRLDAAVLLGPQRGAAGFFETFCDALVLNRSVRDALRSRIERRYGVAPEDFDLAARARTASAPILVFHDRGDREVPWTDGEAIARAWPGAALVSTDGLGHRGILRDPEVAARAAAFLVNRMPRCACGRLASEAVGARIWCDACALERELYDRQSRSASA